MSAGRGHVGTEIKHETPLWWALGLTSTFLVAEVIGGLLTNALVDTGPCRWCAMTTCFAATFVVRSSPVTSS